ncbi:MAG TPA: FAD-dependent oxidoreductase [Propionicimonas sp.]
MADFDAIVVGSGCAGPAAAIELARAGRSVLVVERGTFAGAKNVSGGRLYTHALKALLPDAAAAAPLERRIVRERVSMLSADSATTLDVTDEAMRDERHASWSVLRARFDPWLAEQAEAAGAEYVTGIAVEALLKDGERVTGVRAGEDEITADVVLLCDGVNSLLTPQAVGAARPRPDQVAVGVKQVVELPESVISDRAMCADGEGMAWLFVGDATHGTVGGGFLYTNRDTISVGVVATVSAVMESDTAIYEMLEDFTHHPSVAPMLRGGRVVEHSGHLVAEGGYDAMPPLVGDGVLLAGESAFMCVNAGYTVRGMDLALAAGQQAGRSAAAALAAGDTSTAGLAGYRTALEDSFVLRDLRTLRRFPHFMESTPRVFRDYPDLARDVMRELFLVDGTPMRRPSRAIPGIARRTGYLNVARDLAKGMRAL